MSDTGASLRRKIASAGDLESVVRTMKAMAASNISQYENAVRSLADYDRTVQLGLLACFRQRHGGALGRRKQQDAGTVCAVVFGSDQGLVGQFNDVLAEFVLATLGALPNKKNALGGWRAHPITPRRQPIEHFQRLHPAERHRRDRPPGQPGSA
ncbi:F0F1 ATP synthase subunit gamma [Pseudomonas sp. PCH446]